MGEVGPEVSFKSVPNEREKKKIDESLSTYQKIQSRALDHEQQVLWDYQAQLRPSLSRHLLPFSSF